MRALLVLLVWSGVAAAAPPLAFVGNDSFAPAELARAMGPVDDQAQLDIALLRLSAFYWDHGYATVKVADVAWAQRGIGIAIDEGPRFAIGAVVVKDRPELGDRLRVRSGMTFSRTAIADDRAALDALFQDQGYAFVNVLPLTRVDLDRATIDLTWEIEPGKRARFGRFEIVNAPTDLVRSELGLAEGEPFSMSRLLAGKQRLIARGLIGVAIATRRGRTQDLVDVIVEIPRPD